MTMQTIIPRLVSVVSGVPSSVTFTLPGQSVDIAQEEAATLAKRGWVALSGNAHDSQQNADSDIDAIVDAIAELPSTSFDKDGKPNMKALQNILECKVTAKQRDEAWKLFQRLKES